MSPEQPSAEQGAKRKAEELDGQTIQVRVSVLAGPVCSLRLSASTTVKQLKLEVEKASQTPVVLQRLICEDQELKDKDLISEFPLKGSVLELSLVKRQAEWDEPRLHELHQKFLAVGQASDPSEAKVGREPIMASDSPLPDGLALPEALQRLVGVSRKWNFLKDSCDCSGLVLFAQLPSHTTWVFGDEGMRRDWHKDHEGGCAGPHWGLVAVSSEYHYYFVNMEAGSPDFGAVRSIVNNCWADEPFTPAPFERFLDRVEAWAEHAVQKHSQCADDYEEFLEELEGFPLKSDS